MSATSRVTLMDQIKILSELQQLTERDATNMPINLGSMSYAQKLIILSSMPRSSSREPKDWLFCQVIRSKHLSLQPTLNNKNLSESCQKSTVHRCQNQSKEDTPSVVWLDSHVMTERLLIELSMKTSLSTVLMPQTEST